MTRLRLATIAVMAVLPVTAALVTLWLVGGTAVEPEAGLPIRGP